MVRSIALWLRKEILMKKFRFTLLLLAFSVLAASSPVLSAPLSSQAPALCAASSSAAELPFFSPAVDKSLPVLPKCGACSTTICRGAKVGGPCGSLVGQAMHCIDSATCPADGLAQCVCKTGPIN
jgi:hypothetical protein